MKKSCKPPKNPWQELIDLFIRSIEQSSGFVTIMTPEHRNYEEGGAFYLSYNFSPLEAGQSKYIHIKTSTTQKTAIKGISIKCSEKVMVEMFEYPILTSGTNEILVKQRDRTYTDRYICGTKFYSNPTNILYTGELLKIDLFGTGDYRIADSPSFDEEGFNLNLDSDYLIKITNINTAMITTLIFAQRIFMVNLRE